MNYTPSIKFEHERLYIVDQTLLPGTMCYIELSTLEEVYAAIKQLKVRGAPAIGITAGYGLFLTARDLPAADKTLFMHDFEQRCRYLAACRPTAVNLHWAIERMLRTAASIRPFHRQQIIDALRQEAIKIHEEDRLSCEAIGLNGAALLPEKCTILTHCNTGSLATGGWGTALGVVYAAKNQGKKIHVFVDETRPLGQGARLTFWELMTSNIDCTLITDSTAGSIMHQKKIDFVIFGADRIARNGDVANKIGSYPLAVLANAHNIPCYAAAPLSSFDPEIASGEDIKIEERDVQEILQFYNYDRSFPKNVSVYNPAFDITPGYLLSGIITEKGVWGQPLPESIKQTTTYL